MSKAPKWSPNDLQPGDEVCVVFGNFTERGRCAVVERLTKHHVIVEGIKYRRTTGVQASQSYEVRTIVDPHSKRGRAAQQRWAEYVAWTNLVNAWKVLQRARLSEREADMFIAAANAYRDTVRVRAIEP